MLFRSSVSILCTVALLAGCAVGPDFQPPELKLPSAWQATQSGKDADLAHWWARFGDDALARLLDAAQKDSPTLAKARATIDKARASRALGEAGLWPSVDANADTVSAGSLRKESTTARTSTGTLDASWEIDLFGKTRRAVESASDLVQAREADWYTAHVSLAAEVATDYIDYRSCRIKQDYYADQAISQDKTAAVTRRAVQAGFTAAADLRLADASAASARSTALAQKSECELLVKTLVALTGMDESALRATLAESSGQLPQPAGLQITAVPANLLRQRPDIVSAERSLASTSALIGVAEAARWPSLTLVGSVGVNNTRGAATSSPWSFGPALTLPLFDAGAISANIKGAKADYDSALATYRQTVRDAVKEVEQALVRLDAVAQREPEARQSAAGYRAYLTATEQNWRLGGTSLLNLETARRATIAAEVSLLELQQNRLIYWIALYKAVGGAWQASQGEMN